MLDILVYPFMQRAFIVGALIGVLLPCIGLPMVVKRLSMIGDSLSHASLAGVTIGLAVGINPLFAAIIACVIAGMGIEIVRSKLRAYQEVSTVVILALSVGVAGIFSSFVTSGNAISSYLFGSIITIDDAEFHIILMTSVMVLVLYRFIFKRLFITIFNPIAARLLGINVKFINSMVTLLSATAIALSAKAIGSLIVSSLLIVPVMVAMQLSKTYKQTLVMAMGLSVSFIYLGLIISYYGNLKSGSVIVVIAVITLLITMAIRKK